MQTERASKFLSLILRHKPEEIGLVLDAEGWADVDTLIALANAKGTPLTRELVQLVVDTSDKKRFALDAGGNRIRANQGHSTPVDLKLAPQVPPDRLYHGTATRFVAAIREQGLLAQSRQHVHLSATVDVATNVGARHGKPHILVVNAGEMHCDGLAFYLSANGVWLTDMVPAKYIAAET
jgi:putative RNA 2'-phosphotransferase